MLSEYTIKEKLDRKLLHTAASMLKAIAHPMRIAIIGLLEEKGRLHVKEIHESLGMEQAVASHHLGILRDKKVLVAEREGKFIFYSLMHERLGQVIECIEACQATL